MKYFVLSIVWLCSTSCVLASEASDSSSDTAVSQQVFGQHQGILEASLIGFSGQIRHTSQQCPVFTEESVTVSTDPVTLQVQAEKVNKLRSQLNNYATTLERLAFMHRLALQSQESKDQSKL